MTVDGVYDVNPPRPSSRYETRHLCEAGVSIPSAPGLASQLSAMEGKGLSIATEFDEVSIRVEI